MWVSFRTEAIARVGRRGGGWVTTTTHQPKRTVRPHMSSSHGSHHHHHHHHIPPPILPPSGPRGPLRFGLDAARASQNLLRLLESSSTSSSSSFQTNEAGSLYGYATDETRSVHWHPQGLVWTHHPRHGWTATSYEREPTHTTTTTSTTATNTTKPTPPSLLWLNLSDDRTALAKIQSSDGKHRYVSLLRLDSDSNHHRNHSMIQANDGWLIVREVVESTAAKDAYPNDSATVAFHSITQLLEDYLSIEHGGGVEDRERAKELFAPEASLLAVGTAPPTPPTPPPPLVEGGDKDPSVGEEEDEWSAPSGKFLQISLETYLNGVRDQSPHSSESKKFDSIAQIDIMMDSVTAAATVHVGNGAQTFVFVDHLLLGCHDGKWKILSKTFTPRSWPE